MDRKAIVRQINDLLDNECKTCEKVQGLRNKSNSICSTCDVYKELRELGDYMLKISNQRKEKKKVATEEKEVKNNKKKLSIKIEEYIELSAKGLKDKEIAEKMGIPKHTLANWKYRNKEKIQNAIEAAIQTIKHEQTSVENTTAQKELEYKIKQLETENNILRSNIRDLKERLDSAIQANDIYSKKCKNQERELQLLRELLTLHLQKEGVHE